jgi:hypothetical protein
MKKENAEKYVCPKHIIVQCVPVKSKSMTKLIYDYTTLYR